MAMVVLLVVVVAVQETANGEMVAEIARERGLSACKMVAVIG